MSVRRCIEVGMNAGACLVTFAALSACGAKTAPVEPTSPNSFYSVAMPEAVRSVIAVSDYSQGRPTTTTWTEIDTRDGSYRSTAADGSDDEAFDATSRTVSERINSGGQWSLNIQTNAPFGPPDQGTREGDALEQYVQSQVADHNPDVKAATILGRSAQELSFAVTSSTLPFDHADVVIDAQTGLMLNIQATKGGQPYESWQVTTFEVNPDLSKVKFDISPSSKDDVNRTDDGFVDTQANLVESEVGYAPLLPAALPHGFAVSRIITHAVPSNPVGLADSVQNAGVVQALLKGTGWQKMYVTIRPGAPHVLKQSDPLSQMDGELAGATQAFEAGGGAMAGAEGQVVVSPAESPHVWMMDDSLTVTVSGPFSSDALAAAANSLAPAG
jgi:hypothetical protein